MSIPLTSCPNCGSRNYTQVGYNQYACQQCGTQFPASGQQAAPQQPGQHPGQQQPYQQQPYQQQPYQQQPYQQPYQQQPYQQPGQYPYQQPYQQPGQYPYQPPVASSKNKVAAALLAIFLGSLGIHEFYLGRTGAGIAFLLVTLLLGWLVIPLIIVGIINLIQGIMYLCMSDEEFAAKYH